MKIEKLLLNTIALDERHTLRKEIAKQYALRKVSTFVWVASFIDITILAIFTIIFETQIPSAQ